MFMKILLKNFRLWARGWPNRNLIEPFGSCERNAFGGLCLAIVRANRGQGGVITVKAESEGLVDSTVTVRSRVE
jgi:hypothetical protein